MTGALDAAYAECGKLAEQGDRDRWLASLLAPVDKRRHLDAIHAFAFEIARVREVVSEPTLGEIRFQWWRDVLDGERASEAEANPVSAALLDTIAAFNLPRHAFRSMIEARVFDLYDDPMPSVNQLEGYCGETASLLFRLALLILAGGRDPGGAEAAGHAGVAYAVTGLLRALPWHAAQGRCYIPADILARSGASRADVTAGRDTSQLRAALVEMRAMARRHYEAAQVARKGLDRAVAPVFAGLGLVPLYLGLMEKAGYEPFRTVIDAPQWRRQWALWRAV